MYYRKNPEATKAYYYARQKNLREIVKEYLQNHSCVDCGFSDIRALQFDHVRGIKINNISNMVNEAVKTETLMEEIAKCEIRCANCHQIITATRRINKYTAG